MQDVVKEILAFADTGSAEDSAQDRASATDGRGTNGTGPTPPWSPSESTEENDYYSPK